MAPRKERPTPIGCLRGPNPTTGKGLDQSSLIVNYAVLGVSPASVTRAGWWIPVEKGLEWGYPQPPENRKKKPSGRLRYGATPSVAPCRPGLSPAPWP